MTKKAAYLLVLLHFLYFSPNIYASSIVISTDQIPYTFEKEVSIFKENNQRLSFDDVRNKNFISYSEWKDDLQPNKIYWGHFQLKNNLSRSNPWVLNFSILFTDLEIYAVYEDGSVEKHGSGFFKPIPERTFAPITKANLVKVNLPSNEIVNFYFRTECVRKGAMPKFEIQLSSADFFIKKINYRKLNQGLFMGFVLMMMVYNLFLFFYNANDKAYIYYSFYLLGIVIFSAYNTGNLGDWIVPNFIPQNPENIYFGKLPVYLIIISYLIFLRSFLDLSKLLPTWNLIFKYLTFFAIPMCLLDAYLMHTTRFNPNIADIVTFGTTLIFLTASFTFCYFLYRTKDKKGYFIISGLLVMGIGTLLTLYDRTRTIDFSTFFFKVGTILEVIAFSLGLAFRKQLMEKEKQEVDFQLEKTMILQEQEQKESERLKEIDNLKNRLYTNITHEFRTPLTVIMGVADNIGSHDKEKKIIQRNSSQLLRLINQMLDLSKIESSMMHLDLVQSNIVSFIQYITESFHSMANAKNVNLTFYSEEEELWMDIDESKIEHLTYNLISNAIKFTPSGGKVIFHIKKTEIDSTSFLQLKIKDNGIGIHEDDLPNIFDRFYQTKMNTEHTEGGTGIGLALVKEIVDLLQGNISVKSKPNIGSEFIINLPITQNTKKTEPLLSTKLNNELETSDLQIPEPINNPDLPILLLIEDNKDVVNYIYKILENNYNIHLAYDGNSGIEKAFNIIPDIIISDVMMPKKNGYEVTHQLKNDERTSHIPIVLLTAKATQTDKVTGLEAGADAFLMKPFHKKELLVRLENLLELRKQLIKKFQTSTSQNNIIDRNIPETRLTLDEIFLQKINKVIEEKINDPNLVILDLCHSVKLGHTQVYRKIKALTNLTPTIYIRSIRLNRAMELLRNSDLNVSEVAYQVGFKDPNYFTRVFFQKFNQNPSEIPK